MKPEEKVIQAVQTVGAPETVREQDKIQLVLAYLGLLALVPFLTVKDSEFVKWHAKNGLVLGVGGFVVIGIVQVIPVLGQIVGCLGTVGLLVVDVMAMMKALRGERWRIPVVTDLAAKF